MPETQISFFQELSRRRVIRMLSVYMAASFVLLQVADVTFDPLGLPAWAMRGVIVLLLVGLPITAVLSWVFDLTPDGVVRTAAPAADEIMRLRAGRKIDGVVIAALLVIITSLVTRDYIVPPARDSFLASAEDRSIAVLPFTNIGNVADSAYFADGLSVELINTLSMIPDLRVSSGNSSLSLNSEMSDSEIGQSLKVAHLVRGSVRKAGDLMRVNVNVVRVADHSVVWTNTFETSVDDVFAVQDEMSANIAISLKSTLYAQVLLQMALVRTQVVEAYDAYLLALHYRRSYDWGASLEHAERAIALDPQFTAAYALAARSYLTRVGGTMPGAQAYPAARALVSEALSIEPEFAPAMILLALLERVAGNYGEAERLLREVRTITPGIATQDLANLLLSLGRSDEALEEYQHSYELDPLGTTFYAAALADAGDYDAAEAVVNSRIELVKPRHVSYEYAQLAYVHVRSGDAAQAARMIDLSLADLDTSNTTWQGRIAYVLSQIGREEQARAILAAIEARASDHYVSPTGPLLACVGLGETECAFHWLNKVVEEKVYLVMIALLTSPTYDPLRSDPRFNDALGRLGLPVSAETDPGSS